MEALKLIKKSDERIVAAALLDDSEASAQLVEIARKVMKKKEQQRQNPDIPKEEEKKKRRCGETVDVIFAELLQETSDERIAQAFATLNDEKFQIPTTSDASTNIRYLARWLRACSSSVGFVWARVTLEAERFTNDILLQRLDDRSITTIIKKKDDSYRALLTAWKAIEDDIGYSLDYIASMLKVGALLREFPRLQYCSAPTRLRDHAGKLREMFLTNAEHWARCVPCILETTTPTAAAAVAAAAAATTATVTSPPSPITATSSSLERMTLVSE